MTFVCHVVWKPSVGHGILPVVVVGVVVVARFQSGFPRGRRLEAMEQGRRTWWRKKWRPKSSSEGNDQVTLPIMSSDATFLQQTLLISILYLLKTHVITADDSLT